MSDEGRLVAERYRLVERIGRGGMGTVWRAADELLGRQVAIKQLHISPYLADDELATLYERTRREARSAARIAHPNVVVVHDVVDDRGVPCIVMEYVPSTTLADVLKRKGRIAPDEAARIGRGMIAALRAAHAAGVLHRDVKPGNVLLGTAGSHQNSSYHGHGEDRDSDGSAPGVHGDGWHGGRGGAAAAADTDGGRVDGPLGDGRVVLTDFGIAVASGTSTLTKTGELVGSIDYVAPERVRGGKPGPASDLWALGATLYQALEGRPPFRKDTAFETAYAIATDDMPPLRYGGILAPLVEALLAKDPDARPSAEAAEWALRAAAAEAETELMRSSSLLSERDRARRNAPDGAAPSPTGPATGPTSAAVSAAAGAIAAPNAPATTSDAPQTPIATQTPTPTPHATPTPTPQPAPLPRPAAAGGDASGVGGAGSLTGGASPSAQVAGAPPAEGGTAPTHWRATPQRQHPHQQSSRHQQPHQPNQQRNQHQPPHQYQQPDQDQQQHPSPAPMGHRHPAEHTPAPGGASGPTTATRTLTTGRSQRSRATLWSVVAVTLLAVGAGALAVYLVADEDGASNGARPSTKKTAPSTPGEGNKASKARPGQSKPKPKPSPVPDGYHLVHEEDLGVAFPVPDGWTRKTGTGEQVDYVDPTGKVGIKINVLDFASSDHLAHFEEVEEQWREREPTLKRLRMQRTTFRGNAAAIWEFSFRGSAREFRGIDLGFGQEGKEEYAIYVSAPSEQWSEYRPIFDVIKDSFHTADDVKNAQGNTSG